MKIALVITRMDRGGAPDIVKSLFNYSNKQGCEAVLISGLTRVPSRDTKYFLRKNEDNIYLIPELRRNPNPAADIIALIKLYAIFKRERFDIVHTHTSKAGFIGRIAARLAGIRRIVHMPHGHIFYGYFGHIGAWSVIMLEKIGAFFTDCIVALTELEKADMLRYNICAPGKITIIRSGIALDRYHKAETGVTKSMPEFKFSKDELIIGMIGRLEKVKGAEYFLNAGKYIADKLPRARFLIVGDGPLKEKLVGLSKDLNIRDRVIFTGWREDISDILPILDLIILPSLNEAVGRILLEAGASGKASVAAKVGGVPEILKDGETGILVPPADSVKLAEAVIDLLKDEEKRARMGSAAKDWVGANFSEDKMLSGFYNLYKKLTAV